jgi:hypothetical protein
MNKGQPDPPNVFFFSRVYHLLFVGHENSRLATITALVFGSRSKSKKETIRNWPRKMRKTIFKEATKESRLDPVGKLLPLAFA